jgi:type-F conjugative transfer system mating-pair stabilization protein TraN
MASADDNQSHYNDGVQNGDIVFPNYHETGESIPDTQSVTQQFPQDLGQLNSQAHQESHKKDSPSTFMTTNSDYKYTIDNSDPLIKASNNILSDPQSVLGVKEVEEGTEEIKQYQCFEYEESYEAKCHLRLVAKLTGTKKITKTITIEAPGSVLSRLGTNLSFNFLQTLPCSCMYARTRGPFTDKATFNSVLPLLNFDTSEVSIESIQSLRLSGHHGSCFQGGFFNDSSGPTLYIFEITYQAEIPAYELVWESECEALEKEVDEAKCELVSQNCIDAQPTKVLHNETFTSDCWLEERTYRCFKQKKDECESLRQKGCFQVSSHCVDHQDSKCIRWLQTYQCGDEKKTRVRLEGDKFFCQDGKCHSVSWTANQDMADSISKLAVFNEMRKDMDPQGTVVFNGKNLKCSRNPAGFKNCCALKGWGQKIGLAGCNEKEKELAVQRQNNKCVYVGSFCKSKLAGKCIDRRSSYCCFGSKLSRIFNEQGRRQLGLSWGDPKTPQCTGLTLAQFTQIDLGQVDFSELFNDIMSKVKVPNPKKITKNIAPNSLKQRLEKQGENKNGA